MTSELKRMFSEDAVEQKLRFLVTKLHYRLGLKESLEFIKMVDEIEQEYRRTKAPKKTKKVRR